MNLRIPRKRKGKPRRGPMRDKAYRQWLTGQPCVTRSMACYAYQIDPAHTQNNGTGSKGPDSSCAPLCRVHHQEYDAGRSRFETKYGVDMRAVAAENYALYLAETYGATVL